MKHPRLQGQKARKEGRYENPFPEGTREFVEWREGYLWEAAAEEEDKFQAERIMAEKNPNWFSPAQT